MDAAVDLLSPTARAWFTSTLGAPTEVQAQGWPHVAAGRHTLMCAPTGSGKTLAAFLWCIDRLFAEPHPVAASRCRVLYISPLKALAVDIERNLRAPLRGIAMARARDGETAPELAVGLRTGDTSPRERREMERHPPDILVTTPESLFLLLTSAARSMLRSVRWVIVDEIHSLAANKRGAHLAISLERLAALTGGDPQRIGLSATQRPLDEVARFLVGRDRTCAIVEAGQRRDLDITVEVPVDDMTAPVAPVARRSGPASAIGAETEAPRRSLWPAIHPRVLELIRAHRSTIVFVNSRRLAERMAARLNELAGETLVRAHHGSVARDQRTEIEDDLKAGRIPGLVATSSLELGIDMGAVDLVIQIESPATVTTGIQRIGRAGHAVGQVSRGVILPKYRGDLLACAAVTERMLGGEVEVTSVPRNPVDVLAQQIVAMVAMEPWPADDLRSVVSRAYPFAELGDRSFTTVLDMLDGRYRSDDFSDLRPRVVYDRTTGIVTGRPGAQRLAVTSGGTIPDRGLYTVNILDDGRRVGELDEEMVYELRPGDTFVLGASTWRVAEITASQVLVAPAPGEPGKFAFWHGDALGRPVELGLALGALVRELRNSGERTALKRLRDRSRFDERAARNTLAYLRDQIEHAGVVPDDRTVVVERFRDQLGDWRVCVLSPWGARVHTPWSLVVEHRLRQRFGVEVQSIASDDGFAIRLPDVEEVPTVDELLIDPDDVRDLVTDRLHGSALFAARFRENAARALLLPRRRPGQRSPLWQQRQRANNLLQVASRHPDFPILAETYRECLATIFDMPALVDLMRSLQSRAVRVVEVETDRASPFAASLLFDYMAQYMYEGDAPLAERRAHALTLDRELLAELLGNDELRELLDPAVLVEVELEIQGMGDGGRRPRDADEAVDLLRRLGDLDTDEARARGVEESWLHQLEAARRVVVVVIGGTRRWIAAEDAARYRDALGAALPLGLPAAFLEPTAGPLESLVRRWARTHVPFTAAAVAQRWGLTNAIVELALGVLGNEGEILDGQFRTAAEREHCSADVLRLLRRRTLARLRKQVEPVAADTLTRFAPRWQGVLTPARGPDRLLEVIDALAGCVVPASVLERDVLPARVADYSPAMLDSLIADGDVVWLGRGSLGANDGRLALYPRETAPALAPPPLPGPDGRGHAEIRETLRQRGASFFRDIHREVGGDEEEVLDLLWDLVWSGEVTNDSMAPVRGLAAGRGTTSGRGLRRRGPPRASGRWSLGAGLLEPSLSHTERLVALSRQLLSRHGVLTREMVAGENVPGGFAGLYPTLRGLEEAGRARRGYFIEGLGGSQFALPGAVDSLRDSRDPDGETVVIAATDPANPYGITVGWPNLAGRAARSAGAYVILESGDLRLFVERGGRSLLTHGTVGAANVGALATIAARSKKFEVTTVDGEPVAHSQIERLLRDAGFAPTPRGLVLVTARQGWSRS